MTVTHAPGPLPMTPARRVALAIGVPLTLVLIGWLGFAAVSSIGQASFPLGLSSIPVRHGQLSVSVASGNVAVRRGQAGDARLVGTVRYSLIRPDVTTTGDGVTMHCRVLVGNCELDATLTVPPHTGLSLSTGGGDQTVSGIQGGVDLSSDGGNVTVSGVAGRVSVSTGGGDLRADDLAGVLRFSTDGGNVNGTALASRDVIVHSYGGDATLTFIVPPAHLTITGDGGNITVFLPRNGTTRYDVATVMDGGNSSVPRDIISSASPDKVALDSGGGDITVAYAS